MKRSELKSYIKEQILSTLEEATITTADKYKDVKRQADKDEDIIVVDKSELAEQDDDETDKAAAKGAKKAVGKSKRLDAKIKELKRIEADMKTELNAYKNAEGDDLKNAAKKQLKRLTALKKETKKEIERLENEMV